MRIKFIVICIFLITIATSCSIEPPSTSSEKQFSTHLITKAEKDPLIIEFVDSYKEDGEFFLLFNAYHQNETPIQSSDYEFHLPNFLFDETDVPYELTSFEVLKSNEVERHDNPDSIYLKLSINPIPASDSEALMLPIYMTPSLFENGYPIEIMDREITHLNMGDIALTNMEIKENTLRFILYDNHPEGTYRNLAYTFKKREDDQEIYPVFSRVTPQDNGLHVNLEFADPLSFPLDLIIQRTTVPLPEWRFSFVIPIEDNKQQLQ